MVIRPTLSSLCAVIALSGCSTSQTVDYNPHIFTNGGMSTSEDKTQMQIYITSAESQLLSLEQQESKQCISGQLTIAQTYLTRATQEHNAQMDKDAFITLVDFDRQIRKIRCINQHINGQLGCGYTNNKVVLKRWYDEGDYYQCESSTSEKLEVKTESVAIVNKNVITQLEKNHQLITETLHDFDQDQIKPLYYPSLNKIIDLINSYPKSTLLISGHTDSKGSTEYNDQLSKRRAKNVAKYFTDKGILSSKIVIKNKGEKHLREVEQNNISRMFNRYTSITLVLNTNGTKEF